MGRNWRTTARYLQNTANTVFSQLRDFDLEESKINEVDYPQELWRRARVKLMVHITMDRGFGYEALGRIIGAGHPDNTGSDDWIWVEDVLPTLDVNESSLYELAAATLVAAKINHMRGHRP